jgi:hypothetical protein
MDKTENTHEFWGGSVKLSEADFKENCCGDVTYVKLMQGSIQWHATAAMKR